MKEKQPQSKPQIEITIKNPNFIEIQKSEHVCSGYCHPQSGLDRVDNFPPPDSLIKNS